MQTKPTTAAWVWILVFIQASAYSERKEGSGQDFVQLPNYFKNENHSSSAKNALIKKIWIFNSLGLCLMFIQIDEVLSMGNVEKQEEKMNLWLSNNTLQKCVRSSGQLSIKNRKPLDTRVCVQSMSPQSSLGSREDPPAILTHSCASFLSR